MTTNDPDLFHQQLFLDDTWIEDCARVHRVWHAARKFPGPVLEADQPWEHNCVVAYGSVLFRQDRFQMWYLAWTRHIKPRVCYAESDDGVHWTKPHLGLCPTLGSTANNVVLTSGSSDDRTDEPEARIDDISVIDDPDDAKWPLKALYWDGDPRGSGFGICAARSTDGIQWETLGQVLPGWKDRFNAVSVRHEGKYIVFGRLVSPNPAHGRVAFRTESHDLRRWSQPKMVLTSDIEDPPHLEIYSAMGFPYGDLMLGSIERMHMVPDRLDPEIIWSRDSGLTWQRAPQRPGFIAWGQPETFDSDWINLTANGPIVRDGQLWFYYSGRSACHHAPFPHNHGAIGLATLRIDGFCSLAAKELPAMLLTKPMTWPDGDLLVNVDPRRDIRCHPYNINHGQLRVEARDADNRPINGFSAADCAPITENTWKRPNSAAPVVWGNNRSLRNLKGQRVRLQFELRDAHLYAFRAGDAAKHALPGARKTAGL